MDDRGHSLRAATEVMAARTEQHDRRKRGKCQGMPLSQLAREQLAGEADGVVITHGTDTMEVRA
jgi:Asparaginase, N-terminal